MKKNLSLFLQTDTAEAKPKATSLIALLSPYHFIPHAYLFFKAKIQPVLKVAIINLFKILKQNTFSIKDFPGTYHPGFLPFLSIPFSSCITNGRLTASASPSACFLNQPVASYL